jgi:hypothetical protein
LTYNYRGLSLLGISGLLLFFVSLQKEFANAKKTAFYYHKLGRTKDLRQAAYVELFKAHVDDIDLSEIRNAWQTGTRLGNDYFRRKVESKLGCKVGQSRRGRPKLKPDEE